MKRQGFTHKFYNQKQPNSLFSPLCTAFCKSTISTYCWSQRFVACLEGNRNKAPVMCPSGIRALCDITRVKNASNQLCLLHLNPTWTQLFIICLHEMQTQWLHAWRLLVFPQCWKESTLCKPCLQLTLCQRGPVDFCNCTENVQIQASADCRGISSTWMLLSLHLMVPASSGLKAYSQSCISLSLMACSRIPLCSVHTANVLGVWGWNKKITIQKMNLYIGDWLPMNLLERSRPLPAAESACPRCTPLWQRTGWWRLAPRCPSRCGTGTHRAGVPPRSASPSRWCGAPGSAGNPSSTQLGCKQAKRTNKRDTQTPRVRQNE